MVRMDKDLLQLHRLLDGGLSPEDEKDILQKIEADPRLQREFDGLVSVINLLEAGERLPVDAAFSSEVMKRLPARNEPLGKKIRGFLFGERVLRWNVASFVAVSAVLLVITVSGLFYQSSGKSYRVADSVVPGSAVKTVSLSFNAPEAKAVSLAGDFNKWSVEAGAMKRKSDGTWTIEVPLKPGVYHYMFVVDGEGWVSDPRAESYRDDGFGNKNAILRIDSI
ncbi:MAG: hypothetical protein C0402_12435 [Thermodesulfovibrio sp.]|nr:hypothetical protein [Thermodesulfovibrio sp.]